MPRLAMLFTLAFCGILAGEAAAQTSSGLQMLDGSSPIRAPAPPARMSDDSSWAAPVAAEPQAISNQEMAIRRDSQGSDVISKDDRSEPPDPPLPGPLPIPAPPPPLDKSVTLVSFQERVSAEHSRQAESDSASAPDKPSALEQEKKPLSPLNHKSKIPLAPNGKSGTNNFGNSASGLPSMIFIAGSTGLVLGIFLLLVWIVRRKTPQAMVRLPGEAFEILGRAPLSGRQQVQLLRCGSRLLLISVTPGGAETLTEITDPMEVDRLSGLCRQSQPGSSSAAFKQIFEQLAPRRPATKESLQHADEGYEMTAGDHRGGRGWEDCNV